MAVLQTLGGAALVTLMAVIIRTIAVNAAKTPQIVYKCLNIFKFDIISK